MPKVKQIEKCKHPNSRKTKALAKQLKKQSSRSKSKLTTNIKQNLLGEKLLWFRDNLNCEHEICTPLDVENLILKYLGRFDEELEQIKLKHAIGQRKNRQHASREDIINMTLKREKEEFKNAGIELPDLFNSVQTNLLKNWTGELRFLQNFKFRRFSIQNLQGEKKKLLQQSKKQENKEKDVNSKNNETNDMVKEELLSVNKTNDLKNIHVTGDRETNSMESMDIDG